jgi:hypothetical protein
MDRPEQIWLPEPVIIHGIKVSRTLQGLKYYLHHWQHVQATAGSKLDQAAKQHLQLVIDNLKIHLELTEKQNEK